MSDELELDGFDRWESAFERRLIGRTKILKGAQLFFSEKTGVQPCTVRDVTNGGAGILAQNLQIMPLDIVLSFDGFRTLRNCRLIWRQNDFFGVAFERADGATFLTVNPLSFAQE